MASKSLERSIRAWKGPTFFLGCPGNRTSVDPAEHIPFPQWVEYRPCPFCSCDGILAHLIIISRLTLVCRRVGGGGG